MEEKNKFNREYILWLEEFTKKNNHFTTESYIYYPRVFDSEESKKIEDLKIFYNNILSYGNENYIYPKTFDYGKYYNIKYNNIGYRVIILTGNIRYSCHRIEINDENEFIDFDDVLNNKKTPERDKIYLSLKLLSNFIDNMVEANVPIEAINETARTTINKALVRKKENNIKNI